MRTVLVMPVAPGMRPSVTSGMPKRIFAIVEREASVADQGDFPAAAERRAGEQRDDRPAERLERAVARGQRPDLGEAGGGVLRFEREHALQRGAGEERRLGRGEQDAADARLVGDGLRGGGGEVVLPRQPSSC